MLSKDKKINTQLFKEILESGKMYSSDLFSLKYLRSSIEENSRFAVVAPKKQFKKAFQRNFIKRKVFNIIKDVYEDILPSFNIIFFLKKEVKDSNYEELKKEIITSLKQIKVIN
ncbi:MAG: ribonuclease P protein component [Candidatus Pacebacteria bacterium]|nr:ribonuclease P protein component [Candidatus Paceibacterota bacterium]